MHINRASKLHNKQNTVLVNREISNLVADPLDSLRLDSLDEVRPKTSFYGARVSATSSHEAITEKVR